MIKTYEIDLDDALVDSSSEIFESLGIDIDTAIKMFLTQATLKKGFPFELVIPQKEDVQEEKVEEKTVDEAESETSVETEEPVKPLDPEIEARVAANEALVAQMRGEIGEKSVTPEFDENEDDGTHGNYDSTSTDNADENSGEPSAEDKSESESESEDEDEDETTPENLFDAWA
ncbi:MAG: type II toxin-antitoxin system RelB/DinJ family antitoxin [Treponema sp.]|nr:type II toxin-antitoxin system RelB/DinJ family antitoxin [Treponema sp.]